MAARRALGLPLDGALVVVSGGGWGVGDLVGATRAALVLPGTRVVCLAGRDERTRTRLEASFATEPRVSVLGFTERMSDLLAAADALVHSTGGVTCLEALVRRCPLIAYGMPPGHAGCLARAMAASGLLEHPRSPAVLTATLRRILEQAAERPPIPAAPSAASLVLAAAPRPLPRAPLARRMLRPLPLLAATVVLGGWTASSDVAYPLVSRTLDSRPLTAVPTASPRLALVLRAPAATVPALAGVLRRAGAEASFAFSSAPGATVLAAVRAAGAEPLPEIEPGEPAGWLATMGDLQAQSRALGLSGRFFYLAPSSGFTVGQFLLARDAGGLPIAGAAHVGPGWSAGALRPSAGEIVVLSFPPLPAPAVRLLEHVLADLGRHGLSAVSVAELRASASRGGGR